MNAQQLYEELVLRFFYSVTGPSVAYWEIDLHPIDHKLVRIELKDAIVRLKYQVYEIAIEGPPDDGIDYEDVLCKAFLGYFDKTQTKAEREDRDGTLIWRRQPRYDTNPVSKWDDEKDELVPVVPARVRHRLSIRVYCPRLDKVLAAKPEGHESSVVLPSRA